MLSPTPFNFAHETFEQTGHKNTLTSNSYNDFSVAWKTELVTSYVFLAVYFGLFLWIVANIKLFLIDQKRYKTYSVFFFYLLALVIVLSRQLMFVNIIIRTSAEQPKRLWQYYYIYNCLYVIAIFTKIILGF